MDELVAFCIHYGIDPCAMFQERTITDQPRNMIDAARHSRWAIEPILDATPQRGATQTTDLRQLTYAIAFDDPLCEPEVSVRRWMTPHKGVMTLQAVPPLMRSSRPTGAFGSEGTTVNADLFWVATIHPMDFIPKNAIPKNNLQRNQQHILTIIPGMTRIAPSRRLGKMGNEESPICNWSALTSPSHPSHSFNIPITPGIGKMC